MGKLCDHSVFLELKKHARNGRPELMWQVGVAYMDGCFRYVPEERIVAVPVNRKLATRWLKKAAINGSVGAMIDLASIYYEKGRKDIRRGIPYFEKALYWEMKAWKKGEDFVAGNIALTYSALQKRRQSFNWFRKEYAAIREDLVYIGLCFAIGYGVRCDKEMSKKIFNKVLHGMSEDSEDMIVAKQMLWRLDRKYQTPLLDPISDLYQLLLNESDSPTKTERGAVH